mmetsp:Transcript_5769/g.13301  ORF Transcript_5769/g.13301 Transcript_5769/m.13301 type:complete len:191 (-) Transcript_5769:7-579(-)
MPCQIVPAFVPCAWPDKDDHLNPPDSDPTVLNADACFPGQNEEWSVEGIGTACTSRRDMQKLECQARLREFLRSHDFSNDLDEPRKAASGCLGLFAKRDRDRPIHVAARLGENEMVRLLLKAGADPTVKNSSGKTALDVAKAVNQRGSHQLVIEVLKTNVMSLGQAVQLMQAWAWQGQPSRKQDPALMVT